MPPVAARKMREEARSAAMEKLSARRAEGEHVSVSMVLDVDDNTAEHLASHRSSTSNHSQGLGAAAAVDNRPEQDAVSPEYGDDFESGFDAVAQHVSSYLDTNDEGADEQELEHDGAMDADGHQGENIDVGQHVCLNCQFLIPYPGRGHCAFARRFAAGIAGPKVRSAPAVERTESRLIRHRLSKYAEKRDQGESVLGVVLGRIAASTSRRPKRRKSATERRSSVSR